MNGVAAWGLDGDTEGDFHAWRRRARAAWGHLLLANDVEPKVIGRSLDNHPLMMPVDIDLGGLSMASWGLISAAPASVIARCAFARLRSGDLVEQFADCAEPAGQCVLR
jgi:putative heme transporter